MAKNINYIEHLRGDYRFTILHCANGDKCLISFDTYICHLKLDKKTCCYQYFIDNSYKGLTDLTKEYIAYFFNRFGSAITKWEDVLKCIDQKVIKVKFLEL